LNVHTPGELAAALAHLGIEPLSTGFTPAALQELAARSSLPIKMLFLMDQTRVVGPSGTGPAGPWGQVLGPS
jgi:formamidopyrimidine-DNA glycosylase